MSWRTLILLGGILVAAVATSCGSDDDPAGSGGKTGVGGAGGAGGAAGGGNGGTGATGNGGTSGAAGGAPDASDDGQTGGSAGQAGDSGVCSTFANTSGVVELLEIAETAPAQSGGTLEFGKYILTGYVRYTNPGGSVGPTGQTLKETINLAATTLESVEASGTLEAGVGADERNTYSYTVAGTNIALAAACGPATGVAAQYTATTADSGVTTITILLGKLLVTYTKQ